jgi:maleate isomerase
VTDGPGRAVRRLGVLVVHNDPVPEAELWRTAPADVEIVTGRFRLHREPGQEYAGETVDAFLTPEVRRTIADLIDAGADALALGFVSASVFGGPAFDTGFTDAVSAAVTAGVRVPAFTAGQALRHRIADLTPAHPLLVAPPWFTDDTVAAAKTYLGLAPRTPTHRYDLGPEWATGARQDLFDRGAKNHVPHTALRDQILAAATPATDAVVIPGSGFRTLAAATDVTRASGIPVISANSAVLEYYLMSSGQGPAPVP